MCHERQLDKAPDVRARRGAVLASRRRALFARLDGFGLEDPDGVTGG